jgi:hypothetical protein
MKHLYYLLLPIFIISLNTLAQNQDYTAQVDYYFQHLDKSQVPTGILYERVFPAADVGRFTNTSIDTTSAFHFFTAFDELQTADYTGRCGQQNDIFFATYSNFKINLLTLS